eukprot:440282_1
MKYFVWNFGCLSKNDEMKYIEAICANHLDELSFNEPNEHKKQQIQQHQSLFTSLIYKSQQQLRLYYNEISICSLRDVQRANKFFEYFYERFQKKLQKYPKQRILRATVMSLAQCYYYRLSVAYRLKYEMFITNELKLSEPYYFINTIEEEHNETVSMLQIPKGIAQNKIFKENIFIMLTCIITCTPAFVIGPPGSSKTLSMLTLEYNLDKATKSKQLTGLGINDYFVNNFQCSKLTTSVLIEKKWTNAVQIQRFKITNNQTPSQILFLDEMGLAEQSNDKPLKVLHRLLETP